MCSISPLASLVHTPLLMVIAIEFCSEIKLSGVHCILCSGVGGEGGKGLYCDFILVQVIKLLLGHCNKASCIVPLKIK